MSETESFEEEYDRLEEVVERLDSGRVGDDLTLDEALELYEEGVELVRRCRGHLDDAEATLETLEETTETDAEADV
ncbi:exodeoxyribonuclease VII small subunit [Haladaptatus sp. F3-133]|jgi:exodeoxyribonuclease VII small subunit|uniref:Exodeoxyribonuclease VII small subunit n=1 Tax=Halorutilus salinus TaxID=2487751 RepID=A0A9Q4C4C4_9EURY|nr:exodeoxyribonuclease VII small subunit [Halorutilus salinus]MCX2818229.1 exodeoxyribonuclease VII small subunit [Halorutilus salinus]